MTRTTEGLLKRLKLEESDFKALSFFLSKSGDDASKLKNATLGKKRESCVRTKEFSHVNSSYKP